MKKNLIVLIILIVVIAGFISVSSRSQKVKEETIFCTQEALLCPDGSYVGRKGPKCEFRSCSYAGPYEGKLSKQGEDFFLITSSPRETGEVSYSMPIRLGTIDVGSLLGKNVSVSGSFSAGNILVVNKLLEKVNGNSVKLKIGETGFVNGVRITLNKIISDSRCPVDVQCITAGFASFSVTLRSDTDQETITLASNKPPYSFDSYKISMVNVDPVRVSTKTVKPSDYAVTFEVK